MRELCFLKGFTFYFILFIVAFSSCSKPVQKETEVYANDFEQGSLTGIDNGSLMEYKGSTVLGNYHNDGFSLLLTDLPKHDLIKVSFDLFIHDSWDGNKTGIDDVDGPDIWEMRMDKETYVYTTFSNTPCEEPWYCPTQSYPANFPNNNQGAMSGAFRKGLAGLCHPESRTTWYKITKTIAHEDRKFLMECLDQLVQLNAADPKCDESWSVDNIRITAITLD